jgi:hypothetical protein
MKTTYPGTALDESRPSPEPSPAGSRETTRVDWLFRDALRRRQVHPLMDLVRRYRQQAAT